MIGRNRMAGTVIVVEPASSGTALVDAAKALGKQVLVLTGPYGEAPRRRLDAGIVDVDTNDDAAVLSAVRALSCSHRVEAVLPGMEYYLEMAAKCAEMLGLPGMTVAAAQRVRSKLEVRRCLAATGVPTPAFTSLRPQAVEAERAAAITGFPAVLKPVDGCGSLGVRRVDDVAELQRALAQQQQEYLLDLGRRIGCGWLLESYLDGPEYSLEGLITADGPRVVSIVRKFLGPEPHFVEMGHVVGETLAHDLRDRLVSHAEAAMAALGLPLGVFHAEVRDSTDGPRLIEVNARLGGDRIPRLLELAHGFSLPRTMVRAFLEGAPPADAGAGPAERIAGIRFITGKDVELGPTDDDLRSLRELPWVDEVRMTAMPACESCTSFRDRIGHVVCTAPSPTQLAERLDFAAGILCGGPAPVSAPTMVGA